MGGARYASHLAMNLPLYFAFAWFVWVASITPGPNCSLALAIGLHHGVAKVWKHALGIILGVGTLMLLGLWGTLDLLLAYPLAAKTLKFFGIAYLLYLGWSFFRAGDAKEGDNAIPSVASPKIYQSALMQITNPKAWLLITGTLGAYQGLAESYWLQAGLILGTFAICVVAAVYIWAWLGQSIRQWLATGQRTKYFNWVLGLSLVLTALWLVFQ